MFIGHHAVAFASKRFAPRASLGTLLAAAMFLDLLWPVLVLLGVEEVRIAPGITAFTPLDFVSYPWSHSLMMSVVWSIAFALIYFALRKDRRTALVLAAGVFSHWLLDYVTHRPDLPLTVGASTRVGLGLWSSRSATLMVELILFGGALALYLKSSRPRSTRVNLPLWSYVIFTLVIYGGAAFGPPPPSSTAVAVSALAAYLFIPWLAAADRRREMRAGVQDRAIN